MPFLSLPRGKRSMLKDIAYARAWAEVMSQSDTVIGMGELMATTTGKNSGL